MGDTLPLKFMDDSPPLGVEHRSRKEGDQGQNLHTKQQIRGKRGASVVSQMVKNLPAVQEPWVQSLGWEISLEKEMANRSSILAWKIPWTEEPGGLQSMGCKESNTTERQHFLSTQRTRAN